jgi:hypothetical protein
LTDGSIRIRRTEGKGQAGTKRQRPDIFTGTGGSGGGCRHNCVWDRRNSPTGRDSQFTDPNHKLIQLNINLKKSFQKEPDIKFNKFGIPVKGYYKTEDLCQILKIHPDTFRYRLRKRIYPDIPKINGKRRFTLVDIENFIELVK